MTEPYQAEVTKIKTILWNAQHIIKNAKANLYPDGEETVASELQAALHKLVDVETLVGALHRDLLTETSQPYCKQHQDACWLDQ
jgi:hypothetical protein